MKNIYKIVKSMVENNKYYSKDIVIDTAYKQAKTIIKQISDGTFNKKFFRYGNLKLADNIAKFTLPEQVTCQFDCKGCYAKKMPYDSIKIFRLTNLFIILYALNDNKFGDILKDYIRKELEKHYDNCMRKRKLPIVRFHDSGDIFSIPYLKYIFEIVVQNPKIYFYTYTKNAMAFNEYLKIKKDLKIKNFNIVCSNILRFPNYFDFINNFDNEFKKLQEIVKEFKLFNTPLFFCNYNFEKLQERNESNYNKLIKFFDKNKSIITYNKKHSVCGDCVACSAGGYRFVAFLKH